MQIKIWFLIGISSLGLSVTTAALFLFVWKIAYANVWERFKPNVKSRDKPEKTDPKKPDTKNKRGLIAMFTGAFVVSLLLFKIIPFGVSILLGAGLGMLGYTIYRGVSESSREFIMIKELALLYECIELFTKAGFTIRQSLHMSQTIVPHLQDKIRNCLDHWAFGPLRALEKFGEEIGVKQASILVGLLMQIEESGTKNISGAMEQEAMRLEEMREALVEGRISKKPIYSAVYMFLPVASVLGILIAPLAYRAIQMISSLKSGGM